MRSIYRLVFPHAFAEESVLWPAMRSALPDGEQLTLMVEQGRWSRSTSRSTSWSPRSGERSSTRVPRGE